MRAARQGESTGPPPDYDGSCGTEWPSSAFVFGGGRSVGAGGASDSYPPSAPVRGAAAASPDEAARYMGGLSRGIDWSGQQGDDAAGADNARLPFGGGGAGHWWERHWQGRGENSGVASTQEGGRGGSPYSRARSGAGQQGRGSAAALDESIFDAWRQETLLPVLLKQGGVVPGGGAAAAAASIAPKRHGISSRTTTTAAAPLVRRTAAAVGW